MLTTVFLTQALAAPGASPTSVGARPDDLALVVGLDGYASLPPRTTGKADAERMRTIFGDVVGVPATRHASIPDGAKASEILAEARRLGGLATPSTTLWVFVSAHGSVGADGRARVQAADGDGTERGSVVVQDLVQPALDRGARVVVIADACYACGGGGNPTAGNRMSEALGSSSRYWEIYTTATPRTGALGAAVFEGLRGAADSTSSPDGVVTTNELAAFLHGRIAGLETRGALGDSPLVGTYALAASPTAATPGASVGTLDPLGVPTGLAGNATVPSGIQGSVAVPAGLGDVERPTDVAVAEEASRVRFGALLGTNSDLRVEYVLSNGDFSLGARAGAGLTSVLSVLQKDPLGEDALALMANASGYADWNVARPLDLELSLGPAYEATSGRFGGQAGLAAQVLLPKGFFVHLGGRSQLMLDDGRGKTFTLTPDLSVGWERR